MVPGSSVTGNTKVVKRVVNSAELADLLKLANQMKAAGNESFSSGDFRMAVTRYMQVEQQLGGVRSIRAEEQRSLQTLRKVTQRNLSLAALKNFEWGKAKRACDAVLLLKEEDDEEEEEEDNPDGNGSSNAISLGKGGGSVNSLSGGGSGPGISGGETGVPTAAAAADPVASLRPLVAVVDTVVVVRRAEALMQLGRFEEAMRDVATVLRIAAEMGGRKTTTAGSANTAAERGEQDSVVVVEAAVVRKAHRLRQVMRAAEEKSEASLKKAFGAVSDPHLRRESSVAASSSSLSSKAHEGRTDEKGSSHSLAPLTPTTLPSASAATTTSTTTTSTATMDTTIPKAPVTRLADASIFSSNREESKGNEKGSGVEDLTREHPRLERLRLRREAEEREEKAKREKAAAVAAGPGGLMTPSPPPLSSSSSSSPTDNAPRPPSFQVAQSLEATKDSKQPSSSSIAAPPALSPQPPPQQQQQQQPRRDLTLAQVAHVQQAQHALFSSPRALAQLEAMRFASELHEVRFLHRLKPFKLDLQKQLLGEHGFEQTDAGLREMERAVARHMLPANPEVGRRAKALMCLIMGDIWEESAAL
jgi:hypothetical protein